MSLLIASLKPISGFGPIDAKTRSLGAPATPRDGFHAKKRVSGLLALDHEFIPVAAQDRIDFVAKAVCADPRRAKGCMAASMSRAYLSREQVSAPIRSKRSSTVQSPWSAFLQDREAGFLKVKIAKMSAQPARNFTVFACAFATQHA